MVPHKQRVFSVIYVNSTLVQQGPAVRGRPRLSPKSSPKRPGDCPVLFLATSENVLGFKAFGLTALSFTQLFPNKTPPSSLSPSLSPRYFYVPAQHVSIPFPTTWSEV